MKKRLSNQIELEIRALLNNPAQCLTKPARLRAAAKDLVAELDATRGDFERLEKLQLDTAMKLAELQADLYEED